MINRKKGDSNPIMNERLKKIRKSLDLTQQEFSSQIGTTANVLTNYETGRRNPSASVINNICKTFNVNENWLRTGEGEMFKNIPIEDEDAAIVSELLENNGQIEFYDLILSIMRAYKKLDKKYQDTLNELIMKCYQEMSERKKEED